MSEFVLAGGFILRCRCLVLGKIARDHQVAVEIGLAVAIGEIILCLLDRLLRIWSKSHRLLLLDLHSYERGCRLVWTKVTAMPSQLTVSTLEDDLTIDV